MKHFFCVALVFPLFAGCLAVADTNLPVAEILPDGTSVLVLKGHTDAVLDVAFSPDGKTIVSASADLTARIWDAETGKELKKLEGHLDLQVLKNVPSWLKNQKSAVNSVAFSPDGKKIATGGTDGILIIWDAESGKILQKIAGQPKNGTPRWVHDLPIVRSVVWSPDGSTIATASETVAHLWDADTGKGLHEWEHSYDMRDLNNMRDLKVRVYTRFYPNSIDISHDGKKILVAGGGAFRIWDTDSRKDLLAQLFDDGSRHGFDYSRFNFAVPEDDLRFSIEADISTIRSAVFSPDSKKIVTTSTINYWVSPTEGNRVINGSLRIFDGESGKELRYLKGQGGWDIAFSPDGKRFAVAGADGIIRIRDAETAEDLKKLEGHTGAVRGVAYSPDGKQIVSASEDKTVRIWNIELRKELANTDPIFKAIILEDGANSGFFNFSPDGKKIAAGATDGNTRIWDADTGKILQKFEGLIALRFLLDGKRILGLDRDGTAQILDVESKSLHKLEGKHAYLSPDEKRIATLGPNNTIQIWDTESGKKLWKLEGQEPSFSPDGQKIVTSCREGTRIWDVESGMELQNFEGWNSVFSPDGKIIVTAVPTDGFRGSIKIWDVESGMELQEFVGSFVTFSPDRKKIITNTWDRNVCVWDAESGQELYRLEGSHAQFSPDGKIIISSGGVNSVRIGDSDTGKELQKIDGVRYPAFFSLDGKRIVVHGGGAVQILDAESGNVLQKLIGRLHRISPDGKKIITTVTGSGTITSMVGIGDVTNLVWNLE